MKKGRAGDKSFSKGQRGAAASEGSREQRFSAAVGARAAPLQRKFTRWGATGGPQMYGLAVRGFPTSPLAPSPHSATFRPGTLELNQNALAALPALELAALLLPHSQRAGLPGQERWDSIRHC